MTEKIIRKATVVRLPDGLVAGDYRKFGVKVSGGWLASCWAGVERFESPRGAADYARSVGYTVEN